MKLRTRLSLTALATAAALGTTTAVLLPAASARPLTHTHTLGFTTVEQAQVKFSPTLSIAEDKEINHAGQVIGYDVIRFNFNPKTTYRGHRGHDRPGGWLPVRAAAPGQQPRQPRNGKRGHRSVPGSDRDHHRQGPGSQR